MFDLPPDPAAPRQRPAPDLPGLGTTGEVFGAFLKLGCTSFGGPVAHLGYFHEEFVQRRRWLGETAYSDLVALCQFLPGPASSQVGMGLGLMRAGLPGMIAAFIGFTLPSALLMLAFAYGVAALDGAGGSGWLAGLKAAAVAVVAHAVLGMAKALCPDRLRASLALAALAGVTLLPGPLGQLGVLAAGGAFGLLALRGLLTVRHEPLRIGVGRGSAIVALGLFAMLLAGLPLVAAQGAGWQLADAMYRTGALVFGGGHAVLPLMEAELARIGGLSHDTFLAGYGAVQAVPGPLFSFAAFVGASLPQPPNGLAGAAIALGALFLPSALLIYGALPFWADLSANPAARRALAGTNAAIVGVLGAALWNPVASAGLTGPGTVALACLAYAALALWKTPPALVAGGAALIGFMTL